VPDPTDTDPPGPEPDGPEPDGPEPEGADPVGADPVGADPVGADPDGADPDGADAVDDAREAAGAAARPQTLQYPSSIVPPQLVHVLIAAALPSSVPP